MSLWKVEAENQHGPWELFVRCNDPFEAIRIASEMKTWSVIDGIKVTGVLDSIDAEATPSQTERNEG